VRCTACRPSDGQSCRAWSVRGAYVCSAHGGRAPQVRAHAEFRLWRDRLWVRIGTEVARGMQAFEARMRAEPEVVQAETLAWLAEVGDRLREFRREHGRRPRNSELGLILDGRPGWRHLER
jgi:hypothetical protein